jgi:hypothetical protein
VSDERIEIDPAPSRFALPRMALLAVVVVATGWAFTRHFEGVADRFKQAETIRDETGALTPERARLLQDAAKVLREAYGMDLTIQARNGPVTPPAPGPRTLFIGLDTAGRKASVILPPLLDRALPPELAQSLANGYFDPFFAAGTWPDGLNSFVLAILEALRDAK